MSCSRQSQCFIPDEASRDPEEEVAPILKMRELTVHCEAVSELAGIKDTAGPVKPEYDWISYEVPENSTSRELLSQHLKASPAKRTLFNTSPAAYSNLMIDVPTAIFFTFFSPLLFETFG